MPHRRTTRRRRTLALAWTAALIAPFAFVSRAARTDPSPPTHDIPEGVPVSVDGTVFPAEWPGALVLPLDEGDATVRLSQRRGTLQIGFETRQPWGPGTNLTLLFCPDGEQTGMRAPGFVRINYEPQEHDRHHLIVNRGPHNERVLDRVVARSLLHRGGAGVELALDLGVLGVPRPAEGVAAPALRFAVHWVRPGGAVTWPAALDFAGTDARQMPPDLASAARWGRLTGAGDPSGPGAFSKTQWKEWLEFDRELARRGREAHQTTNLLREEWKKTKKRDGELEAEVLDNFDWIAQHERLTANDLLAKVTVLRYLNRCTLALGLIEALVHHPDTRRAKRAVYERALTYESMGRLEDAAADWQRLAAGATAGGGYGAHYQHKARVLEGRLEAWKKEQEARAEDDARDDLPLVALHTVRGTVLVQLFADDVPKAVEHFLGLVASKFYDGTPFHRVHGDFLAQGGCPVGRDQGCEFAGRGTSPQEIPVEVNERHGLWRGAVGFALGKRRMNGSQFFILTSPRPDLLDMNGEAFTCFGRVIGGMAAVDRIELCDKLERAVVIRR